MSPFSSLLLLFFVSVFPWFSTASRLGGFDVPFVRSIGKAGQTLKRGDISGSTGLGNNADLLYSVPVELGSTATAVHLDTGSSDLWVITDKCRGGTCDAATAARYDTKSLKTSGSSVAMYYGDSLTATNATGSIAFETVTVAGVAIEDQTFAAVDYTTNPTVKYATAGIFGLGFPTGSEVQEAIVTDKFGEIRNTDDFVESTYAYGPTLARIAMSNELELPMFSISLQRNTIDIGGGSGTLSVGKLPEGVTMEQLTWIPVRLYRPEDGGMRPPTFAPNEVYPFRWEIDIDGVFLDGQRVADSTIPAQDGVDGKRTSALIDTGNSLLRGPSDVVQNILQTVSGNAQKTLPCAIPRTLAFQIGGKMFPIDPRDFIGQHLPNDATTCVADNIVATDAPGRGALFRWSLGDPFFKSNLVAFHYGNLTHPSFDPPRVGLLSMVPANADAALKQAVQDAQNNGGNFESTLAVAPTAEALASGQVTVSAESRDLDGPTRFATAPQATRTPEPTEGSEPTPKNTETGSKDNAATSVFRRTPSSTAGLAGLVMGLVMSGMILL